MLLAKFSPKKQVMCLILQDIYILFLSYQISGNQNETGSKNGENTQMLPSPENPTDDKKEDKDKPHC